MQTIDNKTSDGVVRAIAVPEYEKRVQAASDLA